MDRNRIELIKARLKRSMIPEQDKMSSSVAEQKIGKSNMKVLFKKPISTYKLHEPKNLYLALNQHLNNDVKMTTGRSSNNNNDNNNRPIVMHTHLRGINSRKLRLANADLGGLSRGRNSPLPQRLGIQRLGIHGKVNLFGRKPPDLSWFKITLPYGGKFTKEYNIQTIFSFMKCRSFVPLMYSSNNKEATFYVDNEEDANRLLEYDKRITTTDGYKMAIRVRPGYPNIDTSDIDDAFQERIASALDSRYDRENNALDLSSFHRDPCFGLDYFCALFRSSLMTFVLELIAKHTPNLRTLKLDGNKLHNINSLSCLKDKLPNLKVLSIAENKLNDISQLDNIKQLDLQELWLKGNPVCLRFKHKQNDYVSEVQGRFPKLEVLDGQVLQKPISFDVENESNNLPPTQMFYSVNSEANNIATQFLNEYIDVFDSNERQNLLNAYHDHAAFSMSVSFQYQPGKLSPYLSENRNLIKCTDPNRRRKLLKTGKLPVVSFISGLPKTQHIKSSFTLDICLVTKEMMLATVTGLFKELDGKEEPLRYFNKILVIVPQDVGYCILNEQYHVTHAIESQIKQYRELTNTQVPTLNVAGPSTLSSQDMERMALTLSQQTNMNIDWSIRCLQECSWVFENALNAFQNCYKTGKIPSEAFIKT